MIGLIFSQFHADHFHAYFVKMISLLLSVTLSVSSAAKLGFDESLNNTWRCGVFVSEPGVKFEPPLVKYFVLQNYGLTTCPAKFKDKYKKGTFAKSCTKMVSLVSTKILIV